MDFRIGRGFDVHKLVEGRKLILGGVDIPYEKGLLGHSDADVLIHAIIDSIVGAIGQGDIGMHFPDNDMRYRDIDSALLLKATIRLMEKEGWSLVNIDSTIIAESPKLSPHIDEIRKFFKSLVLLALIAVFSQGNANAQTCDGVFVPIAKYLGNGDAIASHAVCLIQKE